MDGEWVGGERGSSLERGDLDVPSHAAGPKLFLAPSAMAEERGTGVAISSRDCYWLEGQD